ncbi:MAG: 2-dehydropantoate 2-reductase [Acidimicrobiaceae bacterium]|nr:2-dehydropantoate 2-reductase [Acidimicrobiaceae bacterium]MCY4280477.1 2-dehydropantoate 2-reductase [Acidimicrobiaceae bacterium]MCY4294840.1 2-dehydropantoate 2-reductase [Acidimicrobiaceae bacterium]
MRICVVGAGAIGGMLAARLAGSGHEVSVVARGEQLRAIKDHGLRLLEADGSATTAAGLAASDDFGALGEHDTVLLALKAHQIAAVADQIDKLCGEHTTVVPLQNGIGWWYFQRHGGPHDGRRLRSLDPDGAIAAAVPAERIVACIAYPAASKDAPGVVRHVEGDRFPVGELDGAKSPRARRLAEMLGDAGFKSRVLTDIRAHLWVKAWGNLAFNPISALTGATLAEICRNPATRGLAARMMTEAADIAEALGVNIRIGVDKRIAGAEAVGDHKTSMLQDLEAGRPLELDPLVGVFVELGELTGVGTPAISAVHSLAALLDSRLRERQSRRPE